MATIVCSKCSGLIQVNGRVPKSCPQCGGTLDNAADVTHTLDRAVEALETVIVAPIPPLTNFGRYQIESTLGSGGFGTVYLARDPKLDRLVAIKVQEQSRKQSPAAAERFAREGRTAAQLRHAGIVSVYNVEEDAGQVFIVSEYVEGAPLSSQLRKGRVSFREAASLLAALASAVEYAHSKGIIHRDIKPGNIMIDAAGNPRLMDFGLAKREQKDPTVTMPEQVIGTPAYMSPEQAGGKPDGVDRRTDVYSLGATLYHLLTNELPFQGDSRQVRDKVLTEEPTRPRTIDKHIPVDLETICLKAMEKNPARRYQAARELAEDLERWLRGEPIVARHISPLERSWRWCRRNPAPAGMIASVALLLLFITIGSLAMAAVASEGRRKEAAAKQVEVNARRDEENARKRIEEVLQKNQELLARAYGERGERHLRVPESSGDFAPIKSLPWMLEAMKLDEKNPQRLLNDRIRLQTLLDSTPRVERMWFFKGAVNAAGVSPKRETFFVAGKEGTVKIWKIAGEGAPVVLTHPSSVSAAAFSPDGTRLATGSVDGLRIWSIESRKCLQGPLVSPRARSVKRPLTIGSDFALIAFSKSGRLLCASARSGISQVWDAETGKPLGAAIVSRFPATTGEFADADRILVLDDGVATRVYDAMTGVEKRSLQEGKDRYVAARVSPDGATIATCPLSGRVVFWNAGTGQMIGQPLIPDSQSACTAWTFSPDGESFTTGAADGTVRTWSTRNGRLLWREQVLFDTVDHLDYSLDGSTVVIAGLQRKVCAISARNGMRIADPINLASGLRSADWANSPAQILAVESGGVAKLWNIENRMTAFRLPLVSAQKCAISADRRVLAVAEPARTICILESLMGDRFDPGSARRLDIGDLAVNALALTDDGSRVAVSAEHQVSILETATHKQISGPLQHTDNVTAMRFTPDGRLLVCASYDGRATVWDVANGSKLYEPLQVGRNPTDIDIDREGKHCAVAAFKGVTLWDLATGERTRPGFLSGPIPSFTRFLRDANRILIAGPIKPAQVWDTVTGQPVLSLASPAALRCIDVSSDKSRFLTGYSDGTARLWFAQNATPASPPFEHPAGLLGGVIGPAGRLVLTMTQDQRCFLWDATSADLLAALSLPRLQSQFARPDPAPGTPPANTTWAFFSPGSFAAHLVTQQGLLVTLSLQPDARSAKEISADVALRAGTEFDGAGGLKILEQEELAARWDSIDQPTRLQSHRVPPDTGSRPAGNHSNKGSLQSHSTGQ